MNSQYFMDRPTKFALELHREIWNRLHEIDLVSIEKKFNSEKRDAYFEKTWKPLWQKAFVDKQYLKEILTNPAQRFATLRQVSPLAFALPQDVRAKVLAEVA